MEKFVIQGGKSLSGDIEVGGAKNAAMPIIAAALLTKEPCEIKNVPRIADVEHLLDILVELGASVEWKEGHTVTIICDRIDVARMPFKLAKHIRTSVLLIGPLLSRCDEVSIPTPGGCQIGSRPLDAHIRALEHMGVEVSFENDIYTFKKTKEYSGKDIFLSEMSVTATENVLLASIGAKGVTRIRNAASEPHVQDLISFLKKMDIVIEGGGTTTLTVHSPGGSVKAGKGIQHTLIYDPIEAGTFIALAAATRSRIRIHNVIPEFLEMELTTFRRAGVNMHIAPTKSDHTWYHTATLSVDPTVRLRAIKKVHNMPYPGFNPDLLQPFAVLMTQAEGTTLIHDWMYEGRFKYIDSLQKMGADTVMCDPHRVLITGPTPLYGSEMIMTDLRAGATLVIAALLATGESHIENIAQVDRGYERLDDRLRAIGADIKRVQ